MRSPSGEGRHVGVGAVNVGENLGDSREGLERNFAVHVDEAQYFSQFGVFAHFDVEGEGDLENLLGNGILTLGDDLGCLIGVRLVMESNGER